MSRFTRYRAKARQKKEESQRHLERFCNNAIETLQVLKDLITRIGEDKWNSLSDEERVELSRKELSDYREFKKHATREV